MKQIQDVSFHPFSACLCLLKSSIYDLRFALLAYFPTSWHDIAEVEGTYHLLDLVLEGVQCTRIVIGGDFNASVPCAGSAYLA